jgi:hypothetical protein
MAFKEPTATRKAGGLNCLAAALAAGRKTRKHGCALMLNLPKHPDWARIEIFEYFACNVSVNLGSCPWDVKSQR